MSTNLQLSLKMLAFAILLFVYFLSFMVFTIELVGWIGTGLLALLAALFTIMTLFKSDIPVLTDIYDEHEQGPGL